MKTKFYTKDQILKCLDKIDLIESIETGFIEYFLNNFSDLSIRSQFIFSAISSNRISMPVFFLIYFLIIPYII